MKQPGFLARISPALKAASNILFSGYGGQQVNTSRGGDWWGSSSRSYTARDYEATVGDLYLNSAFMACVSWMWRVFPEASAWVQKSEGGTDAEVEKHPLTALLRRPNPFYSADHLWQKTILSWNANGNAYWLKARDAGGTVRELYHVPYWQMRPLWDTSGTQFIGSYLQTVDGKRVTHKVEDVVHFRYGSHPRNERIGWSPILAGLVEVDTDNEGGNYEASILRNMAVVDGMFSPKDPQAMISEAAKAGLKAKYRAGNTGDRRASEPLILDGGMEWTRIGLSPEELSLDKIRNRPEDRICALLGIPPMVAGLTSGAQTKTYANYGEALEAAYHNCIIPMQETFAAEIQLQLLVDFSDDEAERVGWDRRKVQALQPDLTEVWKRVVDAKKEGVLTIDEARNELGKDDLPNKEGAVREPMGIVGTPAGEEPPPTEPPAVIPPEPPTAKSWAANSRARRLAKERAGLNGKAHPEAVLAVK